MLLQNVIDNNVNALSLVEVLIQKENKAGNNQSIPKEEIASGLKYLSDEAVEDAFYIAELYGYIESKIEEGKSYYSSTEKGKNCF